MGAKPISPPRGLIQAFAVVLWTEVHTENTLMTVEMQTFLTPTWGTHKNKVFSGNAEQTTSCI